MQAVKTINVYCEPTETLTPEESKQELYRLLDEGRADVLAGRTRPHKEVFDELERRILDGTL